MASGCFMWVFFTHLQVHTTVTVTIAKSTGDDLNLAVWQFLSLPPNQIYLYDPV